MLMRSKSLILPQFMVGLMFLLAACMTMPQTTGSNTVGVSSAETAVVEVPAVRFGSPINLTTTSDGFPIDGRLIKERLERPGYYEYIIPPAVPQIDPLLDGREIKERLERPGYYDIMTPPASPDEPLIDGREYKEWLEQRNNAF